MFDPAVIPCALVVDFDELRRAELAMPLRVAGADVEFAGTIAEAMVALTGRTRIDVVLAGGDGAGDQLLRAIRTIDKNIPVMFVTTWPAALEAHALCTAVVTAARHGLHRRKRPTSRPVFSPRGGEGHGPQS